MQEHDAVLVAIQSIDKKLDETRQDIKSQQDYTRTIAESVSELEVSTTESQAHLKGLVERVFEQHAATLKQQEQIKEEIALQQHKNDGFVEGLHTIQLANKGVPEAVNKLKEGLNLKASKESVDTLNKKVEDLSKAVANVEKSGVKTNVILDAVIWAGTKGLTPILGVCAVVYILFKELTAK